MLQTKHCQGNTYRQEAKSEKFGKKIKKSKGVSSINHKGAGKTLNITSLVIKFDYFLLKKEASNNIR